ncbi:MAG TPA: glutathione S-transferase [Dongiaceae bacterium]|nr:glutathione S-transferase [Dongiaceae bacterium]
MLQLLGRSSSINVRKVQWLCGEIGIPYAREDWGSGFRSTREPEFLALNPNALVPVIKDGDFVLWESNTICRYLAAKHGRADLLPIEFKARALVERWMDWMTTELTFASRYAVVALVRKNPAFNDPAQIAQSIAAWNQQMAILEGQFSATGAHVAGDTFTLADIPVGLAVHRWLFSPIERADYPAVTAYYERLRARPAFVPHALPEVP